MTAQKEWDYKFLEICDQLSTMSKCQSKKVCAIATRNNRIIATGLNGSLEGFMNCDEKFPEGITPSNREEHHHWSLRYEAHAEDNLIAEFAKYGIISSGLTIYCNLQPCEKCTIRLASVGIKRIIYSNTYDKADPMYSSEIFLHAGIFWQHMPLKDNK